ncbi:MAG: response regulator [Krumholzibacteria bacterium]|nr:response regulator [Candidatus Krumholzibacteria bacterium]
MKILVVDDSRAMRRIVTRTIGQAGYAEHDILEAENGRIALELVRSAAPDVVLADWHMPEMSGIELLRELKATGSTVPFGFVTANVTRDMVDQARAAGAVFLLARPFTAEDMAEVLSVFSLV